MNEIKQSAAAEGDLLISIIIPAYNEEGLVGQTVHAVSALAGVGQIIVVDDGSTDNTARVAEDAGATVLRSEKNLGKGGALNLGIKEAIGDIILLIDADLGKSAAKARKLIDPVIKGQADLTIARFISRKRKGGFGLALNLARKGIRHLTGLNIQAPLSGQRALNRKALAALNNKFASGFAVEVAMIIDLARYGLVIREVPVEMSHRETEKNLAGFAHRGRQFWDILSIITRRLF